jgi:hypothetical protein
MPRRVVRRPSVRERWEAIWSRERERRERDSRVR